MGLDGDGHHQVAVAGGAWLALAADAHFLAVLDAGRNPDVDHFTAGFPQADGGAADGTGKGNAGGGGTVRALLRGPLEAGLAEAAAEQVGELGRDPARGWVEPARMPARIAGEEAAEQVLEPAVAGAALPGANRAPPPMARMASYCWRSSGSDSTE
ncbi:hypothetical protein G205_08343 [Arthrobacter nitrophenolicus]|uniref:Uncharacterized protein n=1 Tax=Arthrobacter nitrophenolicus TaxID=683150 RepID=L8TTG3_9MICC|nr:hypothetical protein G205_08343 [Arthrobacter nitrophenolicus]